MADFSFPEFLPPSNQSGAGAIIGTITGGVLAGLALIQQTKLEQERLRLAAAAGLPASQIVATGQPAAAVTSTATPMNGTRMALIVVAGVAVVGGVLFLISRA